jgi:PLP dependent protein
MEPPFEDTVAERVHVVLSKMRQAAEKAGRPSDSIRLVAATKTVPAARVQEGLDAGLTLFGENRLQEARLKIAALKETPARWHFIGHLQRRKVKSVIGVFDLVHSVDSLELAEEINRRAAEAGSRQDVLLEVNIGNEPTKTGFRTEDVVGCIPAMSKLQHLSIHGLMTIPPLTSDPEQARPYFSQLRQLAARIADLGVPSVSMHELSMGMSNDYEVAIEEGATLVRVGTAIFGARHV